MTDDYLKKLHNQIIDAWNLIKKFKDNDGSEEFYRNLINEADLIMKKHNSAFMDNLLVAVIQEIDMQEKKEGK